MERLSRDELEAIVYACRQVELSGVDCMPQPCGHDRDRLFQGALDAKAWAERELAKD